MRRAALIWVLLVAAFVPALAQPAAIAGPSDAPAIEQSVEQPSVLAGTRKWSATYNAYLDGVSDAAVPSGWLKPGKKARVCYPKTDKCITIVAHAGGCSCFDLSDEAFRRLGGAKAISQGVITVTATRL